MSTKLEELEEIKKILILRKEEITVKTETLLMEFVDRFDGTYETIYSIKEYELPFKLLESSLQFIDKRIEQIESTIHNEKI